jgi:hypothetical protein
VLVCLTTAAVNYWSAPLEGACAITVSLNKRGRWGLLKNLKSAKREKEAGPRDKVPQYHDTPEGTYLCGGTAGFPRPRPSDNRPAFLHKISTCTHDTHDTTHACAVTSTKLQHLAHGPLV